MENMSIKNLIVEEANGDILVLEIADLIEFDRITGNIKVDKDIFDDFVEDSYIEIQFVEDEYDLVNTFKMVAEDEEGIYMELMY